MTSQNLRGLVQSLLRGHAAVQGENRAGGKTAFVAGEKQDAGGDLLGCAEPPEQLPRRQRLARGLGIGALLQDLVEIRRVDRSRRDRVAADAVADVIDRHRARQRRHCSLRGAISRAIGNADGGHYRGGVDDGATTGSLHDRNGVFAAKEHAAHIGCHERIPGFLRRLYNGPGDAIARIVDEDVEAVEARDGCGDHALDITGDGDVSLDRDRLRALAGAFRGYRLRVALVRDAEPRSLFGEQQRGRAPDPGAAAGDDADLVLEAHRLIFGGVLDPAQDVARDGYPDAALILDFDVGERLSLLRIDFGDGVGERDGVADEDGRQEAHAIVAQR